MRTETPNKQNPRKTAVCCVTQAPSPWCSCLPRAAWGFPDPPRSSTQVWEPGTTPSSTSCKASHLNHGILRVFEMRTPRELKTTARIRFRECRHISSFQQRAGSNSMRTMGTEWDGAHSTWFCSRLVKWQLRRAGHSSRQTTSPRKESWLNTGMTLTWTRQALCYSLRSRGICIPPHGSRWATPGFVRETHQILIWWAVSETDTPAQVEMEVKMQLRCLLRRKPWASLWLSGKEPTCQGRRHWFDPLSRRIPHVVEQPSPWARIIEPELWSLGAQTAEPICHNYRSACAPVPVLRNEKVLWWAARTLETSSSSKTQHSQK